jgi:hypothetical protein
VKERAVQEKFDKGIIPFKDTDEGEWYTPYVAYVREHDFVSGYKDSKGNLTGFYGPGNNVTNAEILKMVLEVSGKGKAATSRLRNDHWSRLYLQKAMDLKLEFYDIAKVDPDKFATRGAVIKLIFEAYSEKVPDFVKYELSDLKAPEGRFIQYAANKDIVDGYPDGSFKQSNTINRAEVAKILKNAVEKLGQPQPAESVE